MISLVNVLEIWGEWEKAIPLPHIWKPVISPFRNADALRGKSLWYYKIDIEKSLRYSCRGTVKGDMPYENKNPLYIHLVSQLP